MDGNLQVFSDGWGFLRTELTATLAEAESAKTRFSPVELPHDWLIYNAKKLYEDGCGWYRKQFELETGEIDDLGGSLGRRDRGKGADGKVFARIGRGEKVLLRFDGVYMDSTVYVNGTRIGDWKYGYSAFDMDITPALHQGRNCVMVQVRFQSPNSRWYSGAGIYRKVWLKVCPAVYLPLDGTYTHITETEGGFLLEAETEVAGKLDESIRCRYRLWKDGKMVQEMGCVMPEPYSTDGSDGVVSRAAGRIKDGNQEPENMATACISALVPDPLKWDIENPQCYQLSVELCRAGREEAIDSQNLTVGFRTMKFTTDKGFFLNGKHVKLHGMCEHHDLGCLGAAFHVPAMERKLKTLKAMGCNAIRTSHNMPAQELMELADKMGFLVVDEAFDMWERSKTTYDYARFFKEWHERDVRSWIRRDRNHPSLLLWSIGNEIYDTHVDEHGQDITRELIRCVREHDPKENALITIGSNYMPWENAQKCADIVKVAGYNYAEKYYEAHHKEHPDWIMYGSETASTVQSRGIYRFPLEQPVLADEDEQCSSLGNATTSWGARSWEKCITDDRDAEFICGQFAWSGFDYIGEPTPYHTKNSYFGQIDTAGFPKDSYYAFQAEWTDGEKAPMVHLFPYWDFNPGQQVDVRACTNGTAVELFVNGVSMGRQEIDHEHGLKLIAGWKVAYEPGTITAVAYDAAGREIARDSHTSFGDSKRIVLKADKTVLRADGEDMCFVTVETRDENGNPVENAADYVQAQVSGPGRILGMDNGDSTDYDNYKTTVRKLFSGKLLVVVGSRQEAGEITLTLSGRGLESGNLVLRAEEADSGRNAGENEHTGREAAKVNTGEHRYLEDCSRIRAALPERVPVRKLELSAPEGLQFGPERQTVFVEANLYPADTTDRKLVWKVVNAAGIDIGFAKIEAGKQPDGREGAFVTALGDGQFFVRCMAKQGEGVRLISQLECEAKGLGQAFLNPYELVSAGLFTGTIGEITNGNEKGIATARDGESGVIYENIDFGDFGSDEITLPVFALSDDECFIDFWLGVPYGESSRQLATLRYQKPSRWNEYQEETYRLPERIKGVATIGFVMHTKLHLKGFSFRKLQKAYECLSGGDADKVYGDAFRREGAAVRGIGNNVTLEYNNMDFGDTGADRVSFTGYTPLAGNTIHIHFTDESGETVNRIVEFAGSDKQTSCEQTFRIERLKGRGKIELIFLPGSNFDLESIQFHRG